jgi:sirohydrochlorin cobaltochelatase
MAESNHIIPQKTGRDTGVIVLAHGATSQWNSEVERTCCTRLANAYPTIVVFGMAPAEKTQDAINQLEVLGVQRILIVPFLISSHSELFRQIEYMLKIRTAPDPDYVMAMHTIMQHPFSFALKKISDIPLKEFFHDAPYTFQMVMDHGKMSHDLQVESRIPLTLLRPLDSHPLVSGVIEERTRELSRDPSHESIVLVAHGPLIDADDRAWLGEMETLVKPLRSRFRSVDVATIRDDAKETIKNRAIAELREKVRRGSSDGGRVIIIPLLISRGGIEREIRNILSGLNFSYNEMTLLPHQNIERWLLETVEEADRSPDTAKQLAHQPLQALSNP